MHRRLPLIGSTLALFALPLLPAAEAGAQQAGAPEVTLVGSVVDAGTGAHVPGAAVLLDDRADAVLTDRDGHFTARGVRVGTRSVMVVQLGYDTLHTEIEVDDAAEPITLRLTPDPVVLERVTAMVDRFEARRNAMGTSVRAFDSVILGSSSALNMLEFLQTRTMLRLTRCSNPRVMAPCARVRGRTTPVEVYLDGSRIIGGLEVLAAYRPEEIYTLEVVGGGRAVRAYTHWYMETIARGRRIPTGYLF